VPTFSDESVRAMICGTSLYQEVPYPSKPELTIAVRVLSEAELDSCRVQAQGAVRQIARKAGWDPKDVVDVDPDLFERLHQRAIVARAFYDPDTTKSKTPIPFFTGPDQVAEVESVVVDDLMRLYLEHQRWVNPLMGLDEEGVRELVETLGKEQRPEVYLGLYERDTLVRCVISLASLLSSSPTSKSSPGPSSTAES